MNPRIKKLWTDALRGKLDKKYVQTAGTLRDSNGHCCLGVLCDLHSQETGNEWGIDTYLGDNLILPGPVMEWAGLTQSNPTVRTAQFGHPLASLNDRGFKFEELADLIDKDL